MSYLHFIAESNLFVKSIMACELLGILCWFILTCTYRSMIRSTENLGKTKKKWLMVLRRRYVEYHNKDIRVNNVEAFVEKVYNAKRVLGITCSGWQTLERLMIVGCAMIGAAGALLLSQQGVELKEVMFTYLVGVTGACSLLFLDILQYPEHKRIVILTNMKHFLENILENRIQGQEPVETVLKKTEKEAKKIPSVHFDKLRKPVSKEEQELVEDVIQEFFA